MKTFYHAVSLTSKPEISDRLKARAKNAKLFVEKQEAKGFDMTVEKRALSHTLVKLYTMEMNVLTGGSKH